MLELGLVAAKKVRALFFLDRRKHSYSCLLGLPAILTSFNIAYELEERFSECHA